MLQNSSSALQFVTIVARNYLAHAFVLGDSVLRAHPEARFSVFVMDDSGHEWQGAINDRGLHALYPDQLFFADYRKLVFQYNITEASTAMKPFVLQSLLDSGAERVIYLDPDILCLRRLDEAISAMDHDCIVLTPHMCSPAPRNYFPDDREFLRAGVFNLGFLALRKSPVAGKFLAWWEDHLRRECLLEPEGFLFVDQKWVDLAPACFPNVSILRNPAYNIAYWNLHERALVQQAGIFYEQHSGEPAAFFHFSGFSNNDPEMLCKYSVRNPLSPAVQMDRLTLADRPDIAVLFDFYRTLLRDAKIEFFSKLPYGYACYTNGELISKLERELYLSSAWQESSTDPFAVGPGTFHNACRKAGIRAAKAIPAESSARAISELYSLPMRLIGVLLRLCLRVLGPDRYAEFAKYMRHRFMLYNHSFLLPIPATVTGRGAEEQTLSAA